MLANAIGIAAFLAVASLVWIEPELANEPGASGGDFIVWGITALPILAVFLLAHLVTGLVAWVRGRRYWIWSLMLTASCWIAAAIFDNAHHGI